MKGLVVIAMAVTALVALFAVPGALTRAQLDESPVDESYAIAFRFLASGKSHLRVRPRPREDGRISLAGGGSAPKRCLKLSRGGSGWLCVSLTPDGRGLTAAWLAPSPGSSNVRLIIYDDDQLGAPEF